MKRFGLRSGIAAAAAFGLMLTGTATAAAGTDNGSGEFGEFLDFGKFGNVSFSVFQLTPLNETGARGVAQVTLRGNEATVRIFAYGLLPGNPHAQHFHIQGKGRCPTEADDTNGDDIISTVEGRPDYGAIGTSLTTRGDTSPASALAVKRFPTAPNGFVSYSRTIHVSDATAQSLRSGNAVIVLHGIDTNGNGKYDDSAGPSSLPNTTLPLEATAPAACGNQSLVIGDGSGLGVGLDLGF